MGQRCGSCKIEQPEAEFSASHRGKVGTWCRTCVRAHARGERITTPHPSRTCVRCGTEYVPGKIERRSRGLCSRECKEAEFVQSGRARDARLRRKYGITAEDYDRMLAAQGGGCAICGKQPEEQKRYGKYLHVDHCHETGRIRGLLCDQHNLLIGRWDHDPVLLRRAADYIEGN